MCAYLLLTVIAANLKTLHVYLLTMFRYGLFFFLNWNILYSQNCIHRTPLTSRMSWMGSSRQCRIKRFQCSDFIQITPAEKGQHVTEQANLVSVRLVEAEHLNRRFFRVSEQRLIKWFGKLCPIFKLAWR